MLINRRLLPLKGHMFLFFGCIAPILAFVLVLALQLGIPLPLQGTLTAFCLLFTIVAKPLIAALADAFPSYRKVLFLAILGIMVTSFSAIKFIPTLEKSFQIRGRLLSDVSFVGNSSYNQENITEKEDTIEHSNGSTMNSLKNYHLFQHGSTESNASLHGLLFLLADNDGSNPGINSGKECTFICESLYCSNLTETERKVEYLSISLVSWYTGKQASNHSTRLSDELVRNHETQNLSSSDQLYQIEGIQIPIRYPQVDVSIQCLGGEFVSEDGRYQRALRSWQFWLLAVFMIAGQSTFNTAVSITDAITVDTIENDGSYGVQRAWGTIGWGVIAPISGLLVDWWSGNSSTKDYTPAFLLCFSLGALDLILSAAYLRVPKIKDDSNILENLRPLLKQSRFFIFCCFAFLNGFLDGIGVSFIFVMQEDMAKGTSAVNHMKFLQGLTLLVPSLIEVPFMFAHGWFMKQLGAQRVLSLVFIIHIFHLLGQFIVGKYGSVWATLVPELLNGACYGLGYAAIVAYTAQIAPTGTSNTVQSVVNICYESFGYALAVFVGGLIYNEVGGPYMYLIASGFAVLTFICHLISLKLLAPSRETRETEKYRYVPHKQEVPGINQEESESLRANDES